VQNLIRILAVLAIATGAGLAVGHSGGTDKNGCHTDHKTGDYHCHKPR